MKQYYQKNKDKWNKRRREKRDEINAAKRAKYAEDPEVQAYYKTRAKQYRVENPHRRRHAELKARYGLTPDQYDAMLVSQNNACAVCKCEFIKTPHVDHCHDSGKVRGLLCFNCNRAIGHFQNDPSIMVNAIKYLRKR